MAEYDDDPAPAETPLDQFKEIFQSADGREWAAEATARVQDFAQQKQLVDLAQYEADQFAIGLGEFKSGLVDFVGKDPTGTDLALDLVPLSIAGMLGDNSEEHGPAIAGHILSEIARAGVQSYAIRDEAAARSALDRYAPHLTDDDRTALDGFIGTMATARAADHATQVHEEARRNALVSDTTAHGYWTGLTDKNGDVRFPNNWLRDMAADPRVEPQTKAELWRAHDRLMRDGDPLYSDPAVVVPLLNRMADPRGKPSMAEVLSHAGAGLSVADTAMLSAAAFPQNKQQQREVAAVAATLRSARGILAAPEYGAAGQAAFGRFVNWLLPEYRNAGIGSLDPKSENWVLGNNMIEQFMPRGGDVMMGAWQGMNTGNIDDRPSLDTIFGRKP